MRVIRFVSHSLGSVVYLVLGDAGEAVMIDAGAGAFLRAAYYSDRGYEISHLLLTHGHFDHVCDAGRVRSLTGAPVVMGADDIPLLELAEGMCRAHGFGWSRLEVDAGLRGDAEFEAAGLRVIAMHVPGHSPGSYAYYFPEIGAVFTGDTLFRGAVGRWDLPGSNLDELITSLRRLVEGLPEDTVVYPGHGEPTTIGRELRENRLLRSLLGYGEEPE